MNADTQNRYGRGPRQLLQVGFGAIATLTLWGLPPSQASWHKLAQTSPTVTPSPVPPSLVTPSSASLAVPPRVTVGPQGAQIYVAPRSNAQILGTYRAGIVLSPTLKGVDQSGQIWFQVGSSWILGEAVTVPKPATPTAPTAAPVNRPPTTESPPPIPPNPTTALPPLPKPLPATSPASAPQPAVSQTPMPQSADAAAPTPQPAATPASSVALPAPNSVSTPQPTPLAVSPSGLPGPAASPPASPAATATTPSAPPQPGSQTPPQIQPALLPGSITAPPGVVVTLQPSPATQLQSPFWGASGEKVNLLKVTKGKDGLAWYQVQMKNKPEAKGWVRGDEVRLLSAFTTPRPALLSAPSGSVIYFYEDPTTRRTHAHRGNSGDKVEILKQMKGENGYAWYFVLLDSNHAVQGWVRGQNVRLKL